MDCQQYDNIHCLGRKEWKQNIKTKKMCDKQTPINSELFKYTFVENKPDEEKNGFWKFSYCFKNYVKGTSVNYSGRWKIESEIGLNEFAIT